MAIVRELVAQIGFSVDSASFKFADSALAKLLFNSNKLADESGKPIKAPSLSKALSELDDFATKAFNFFNNIFQGYVENVNNVVSVSRAVGGISTQTIQGIGIAASFAGVGIDQLKGTLVELQSKMYATTIGSKEAILGFSRLGVSIRDSSGKFKPATKLLEDSVEALIKIEDPVKRTGKALASVGQSALDIANTFAEFGPGAFKKFQDAGKDLGAVISDQDIVNVKAYNLESKYLELAINGIKNAVGSGLTPALTESKKRSNDFFKIFSGPINASVKDLSKSFGNIITPISTLIRFGASLIPVFSLIGQIFSVVVGIVLRTFVTALEILTGALSGVIGPALILGGILLVTFFPVIGLIALLLLALDELDALLKGEENLFTEFFNLVREYAGKFSKWIDDIVNINPGDSFLVRFFKSLLGIFVKDIPEGINEMIAKLVEFFNVPKKFSNAFDSVKNFFREQIDFGAYVDSINKGKSKTAQGAALVGSDFTTTDLGQPLPTYSPQTLSQVNRTVIPTVTLNQNFNGSAYSVKEFNDMTKNASREAVTEAFESVTTQLTSGAG